MTYGLTDLQRINLDEDSVAVQFIGSGLYSAVFQSIDEPSRVFILTNTKHIGRERDRSKEVLALARTYHKNKHLPQLKLHGLKRIAGRKYEVWETRYSLSAPKNSYDSHLTPEAQVLAECCPRTAKEVGTRNNVSPSIVAALKDIERACQAFNLSSEVNTGRHYHFDLHNENFGLDPETQTLILRDPITAFF